MMTLPLCTIYTGNWQHVVSKHGSQLQPAIGAIYFVYCLFNSIDNCKLQLWVLFTTCQCDSSDI
jgi:hypothetical protein